MSVVSSVGVWTLAERVICAMKSSRLGSEPGEPSTGGSDDFPKLVWMGVVGGVGKGTSSSSAIWMTARA
jgi:hypothetical protein